VPDKIGFLSINLKFCKKVINMNISIDGGIVMKRGLFGGEEKPLSIQIGAKDTILSILVSLIENINEPQLLLTMELVII